MNDDIVIRWTRPDERGLFTYSSSIVESILTCPVYGLVRYYQRRYYPTGRVLPLEAGGAMHDVFAAVRLWQLWRRQGLYQHFKHHAERLFGAERVRTCWRTIDDSPRDELLSWCYKILNTADYYDDPSDRVRTIANMEETTVRYVDEQLERMEANPIWVKDVDDPTGPVGIEQPFDIIVEYRGQKLRYIGTIDGIVCQVKYPNTCMIDDNKTASRLDDAWRRAWSVKSQPTGYVAVAKMLTDLECHKARLLGIKIKQTRSAEDYLAIIEEREPHQIKDWVRSLFFAKEIVDRYGDNPLEAPQFTHSCNRYFRACSFVEMCGASAEDRVDIYENLVEAPLSPSQLAVGFTGIAQDT